MWVIALRDLQMRRRRFVVAVVAVGLVFGITLLLDGFTTAIHNEVSRTVDAFHAQSWLVPNGSAGPFTPDHLVNDTIARGASDARQINPMLALPSTIAKGGNLVNVNVIGTAEPLPLQSGRWPRASNELVANDDLGVDIGKHVTLSKEPFIVVGRTAHLRYFAGTNLLFLRLPDAQRLFAYGQPLATGFVVHGPPPAQVPAGLVAMSNAKVIASLRRPIKVAASTINFLDVLLWIVAAGIIGTILYMTSLERLRDFAALKAIGARNSQVFWSIAIQAVVLSVVAGIVAWIAAALIKPVFPTVVEIPLTSYPLTMAVAIGIGLLGSVAGVRRAMSIDPALAFGG